MKGRKKKRAREKGRKERRKIYTWHVLSERKSECYGTSLFIESGPPQ